LSYLCTACTTSSGFWIIEEDMQVGARRAKSTKRMSGIPITIVYFNKDTQREESGQRANRCEEVERVVILYRE